MATISPSYRLSDAQWEQIREFLPTNGHKGGQWKDHRQMIDGILWALSDGGRWRNLPAEFGPWQTGLRPFPHVVPHGAVGQNPAALAGPLDEQRPDRLGTVLHRWLRYPGAPVGGRGGEKKIRRPLSRRTTPWVAVRAALAPSCT